MKKRILSLILALSMALSVLPLGAFAEGSLPELVMKNGYPVSASGSGWSYDDNTQTLTLTSGTFDFSYINPQGKTPGTPTTTPVACAIKIEPDATITGGTFNATVDNGTWLRSGGTISNGIFNGDVINEGTIKDGTFNGNVENTVQGKISGGAFSSTSTVQNYSGTIEKGTFEGSVKNWDSGTIKGGTFAAGLSKSDGKILGGVFNGVIEGTTGAGVYHITVDEASPGAKIEKVNGVPAVWDPYVVIESGETKEVTVTVTANTDIYSLNYEPLGPNNCNSSHDGNNMTVKFTMPKESVKIGCGGLIMGENGLPDTTGMTLQEGKYVGNGWEYKSVPDQALILTSGTYDFSYINPQTKAGGSTKQPVLCEIEIQSGAIITGGNFEKEVRNKGEISGGTFKSSVTNPSNGTISGGTFSSTSKVYNNSGTIEKGTFNGEVTNHGNIKDGTFEGTVKNWTGTISGGTFKETVINSNGEITGGTFAGSVTNTYVIYGGVFNGKTGLDRVTGVHSITWDAASPRCQDRESQRCVCELGPLRRRD